MSKGRAVVLSSLLSAGFLWNVYGGEIFIETSASDGKITIAKEARDYLTTNNIDYNLDVDVLSPLGNPTYARIKYESKDTVLTWGDFLLFHLSNAYFSSRLGKCWLMFYEHNGIDVDGDGIGDNDFNLNNDYDTNDGYIIAESLKIDKNDILFRVSDYKAPSFNSVPSNGILYLSCTESGEPFLTDMNRDITDPPAQHEDRYNIVINIKKPSSIILRDEGASSVCIEVPESYSCCPISRVNGLIAEKKCFIDFKQQFDIDINPKISYINAYDNLNNPSCSNSKSGIIKCVVDNPKILKRFVDESSGYILTSNSCTDEYASSGVISILNNPDNDIEDPIHLLPSGWKGKLKVSLYDMNNKYRCDNSSSGYKALDFTNDRVFIDNNGSPNSNASGDPINRRGINDIPLTPGKSCSTTADVFETGSPSSSTVIAPQVTGWSDDVYIGVNGEEFLRMIKWGLSLEFDIFDNDNNLVSTYTLSESSEKVLRKIDTCCYDRDTGGYFLFWKPSGDEAYVPYMLNTDKFRIVVSNNSCWDAEIYARVWDEKGRVADNVYIGTVKANSVKVLFGNQIFSKARSENPDLGKGTSPLYSVILTVGAPKRDVEFAAYDNRETKTKMIPVYDLSGESWTYRNIDLDEDSFEK